MKKWYPEGKEPLEPPSWWEWQVPELKSVHYLLMMFVLLVGLPWMLGIRFTALTLILNVLLCDFILYSYYKRV
jgi:hypothetical protein